MSISIDGIKNIIGSIWKSLPTEIVVLLGFLIALSNMDFLPLPILQALGSTVSVASFAMLYFRMYNKVAHDLTVSKAVRLAEKKYITESYHAVRMEYIHIIKTQDTTLVESLKEAIPEKENEVESESIIVVSKKTEPEEIITVP